MTIPRNLGKLAQGADEDGVLQPAKGGTGATSTAAAPFAQKGANSDITSLSGLTTPLSVAQGGTNATTAADALTSLGAYPASNPNGYTTNMGTVTEVAALAGTGIAVTGSPITSSGTLTITNTAPDQTVSITSGTGISATGTYPNFTVTNTAPDQTVSITGGTGISATGTYPNFTVTNTAPDQTVALTAGTGISVSGTYPNFTVTNTSPSTGGTVTSVSGTGTVNGLSLTGTVTSSGNLTLGGTLSNVSLSSQVTGTLPIANGGTGQTTKAAGFNALSPITSNGDLIIGNGANSATRLAIGTTGQVLTSNGTTASWQAAGGGDFILIQTLNVSSLAQVDFSLSNYDNYLILAFFTTNATTGHSLRFINSGGTVLTAYERSGGELTASYTGAQQDSVNRIEYNVNDWSANDPINIAVRLFNVNGGISSALIEGYVGFGRNRSFIMGGYAKSDTSAKSAVRFFSNTGAYTGRFSLYGIKS